MVLARYPAPDRSNFTPARTKGEDGVVDIGWNEGITSDGRPYRAELWAADQVWSLTLFMSNRDMEEVSQEEMESYLEREGLIIYWKPKRYVAYALYYDASNQPMWSINIVVGDESDTFIDTGFPILRYEYGE